MSFLNLDFSIKFDRKEEFFNFNTGPNEKYPNLNRKSSAAHLYHY